jgi:mono/diheme cytochrome c family protein
MKKTSIFRIVALLAGLALILGILVGVYFVTVGVSARPQPGRLEMFVAHTLRGMAIRMRTRSLTNPIPVSEEVVAEARDHFADHCASCHGNDGSGNSEMGRGLYPRAPDMRLPATQNLSDGELFYIIENGVRLTGMPAWSTGTPAGETASWHLVHFIRRLPHLTDDDMTRMEQLNPQSPEETRQKIEEEKFLRGDDVAPPPQPSTSHEHTGAAR